MFDDHTHLLRMATPTLRTFVSEKEIEEVKKRKQEEWERVRKPDQPLGILKPRAYNKLDCEYFTERPQEVYDHRTLYERLKQQKDKKQEEWEEQFKFSKLFKLGGN